MECMHTSCFSSVMMHCNSYLFYIFEKGPQGTPFEGGTFEIDITIPTTYPYQPPKVSTTAQA